ncbi:hypothetical protein [Stenotrophomonas pavanii]|uniref:hypothetical protein n=1 Tax=Stenotrophomonas pavanii TaxID=487698 RepID=UPI0039C6C705
MNKAQFEKALDCICAQLTAEARQAPFRGAKDFENRVREVAQQALPHVQINLNPADQAFPDVCIGEFGIEVKFTTNDTWRSVANSVQETNRDQNVRHVYIVFGKMGGLPEVRWGQYELSVVHVRTSHVPRFEVEIGAQNSLFDTMGVGYDDFRQRPMHEKMEYVRAYARQRLKPGERLWWLEDREDEDAHSLPIQARLYTKLPQEEKTRLRAEAILLCPRIVSSGRSRDKYDDVVLYLLTYHGVLCHQARDLFSAGSVANPDNDDEGGVYIARSIKLIEQELILASLRMESELFVEYWGNDVPKHQRIQEWVRLADRYAKDWTPSEYLFDGRFA